MRVALWGVGLALVATVLSSRSLAVPWAVAGRSMQPVLEPGDRVLVDLWTYRHRAPRVGEIALFSLEGRMLAVKRVAEPPHGLPSTARWVLGENPRDSGDSREFGAVSGERFRGRVVWRYWPLARFGPVR
jgi:signal peptidase I